MSISDRIAIEVVTNSFVGTGHGVRLIGWEKYEDNIGHFVNEIKEVDTADRTNRQAARFLVMDTADEDTEILLPEGMEPLSSRITSPVTKVEKILEFLISAGRL